MPNAAANTIIRRKPVARESTVAAEIESIDRRMVVMWRMVLKGIEKVSEELSETEPPLYLGTKLLWVPYLSFPGAAGGIR